MHYLHLSDRVVLPDRDFPQTFKAILLIEQNVSSAERAALCRQLLDTGCRYAMVWGSEASNWPTAFESAMRDGLAADAEVPNDRLIIVTTHDDEAPRDVFWFAQYTAMHPVVDTSALVIVHLAPAARESAFRQLYVDVLANAQ